MREFILKSRQFSPERLHDSDTCRICEFVGSRSQITHCVELVSERTDGIVWALSCDKHIRNILNDVLKDAGMSWRAYVEPSEHIRSAVVHTTAADLMRLAGSRRVDGTLGAADVAELRTMALRVHEAARYLEHYENMNGGNDDE